MSTSGEAGLLRKSILRRLEHLRRIIDQPVNEDTNLEKLESLQTWVIPKVEKAVLKLEMDLQKYSWICDPMDLDKVSDQVD